jgi:hypothetical protein
MTIARSDGQCRLIGLHLRHGGLLTTVLEMSTFRGLDLPIEQPESRFGVWPSRLFASRRIARKLGVPRPAGSAALTILSKFLSIFSRASAPRPRHPAVSFTGF